MMTDLASWLLSQIKADEAAARAVEPLGETVDMGGNVLPHKFLHSRGTYAAEDGYPRRQSDPAAAAHFARHDPARVLAECAAKRRIVAEHDGEWRELPDDEAAFYCQNCFPGEYPCPTLLALAQPYADRDGFDPAWGLD